MLTLVGRGCGAAAYAFTLVGQGCAAAAAALALVGRAEAATAAAHVFLGEDSADAAGPRFSFALRLELVPRRCVSTAGSSSSMSSSAWYLELAPCGSPSDGLSSIEGNSEPMGKQEDVVSNYKVSVEAVRGAGKACF